MHRGTWRCTEVWRYAVVHIWVYRGVGEGVQRNTEVVQRYTGCTEVHGGICRGAWRCTGGTQKWAKVHRGVLKCMEECIGLQRGVQGCVEVYRGLQRGVQRCTEGCVEVWGGACRGMRRCGGAWIGMQWYMGVCKGVQRDV